MKLKITVLATLLLTALNVLAITIKWDVDATDARAQSFTAYHGETLTFATTFRADGLALSNVTASTIYYQTNGMGTAWWHTDGLTFAPSNDVGATIYRFFIAAADPTGTVYRANGTIRMLASPGYSPNALTLPRETIDFAAIDVSNAPWATTAALASMSNSIPKTAADVGAMTQADADGRYLRNRSVDGYNWFRWGPEGQFFVESSDTAIEVTAGGDWSEVTMTSNDKNGKKTYFSSYLSEGGSDYIAYPSFRYFRYGEFDRNWYFPAKGGTFALTDDIPTDEHITDLAEAAASTKADAATVAATIAPIETTVNAWQTYWDGDDVRVTVTNYYGSLDLPSLYLEQKITEGGTNYYKTIWTEKAMLNVILDRLAQLKADVDTKADRSWGFYDSHTGEYAPDGFTSISSGAILVSKDMSYQKTVTTGGGEVWVLTANDPTVITGTETNGFFRITDSEGNNVFEVVKGDKRVVPATTSAVAAGNNSLTITYNVVSQEHPSIEICDDLVEQDWKAEDDAGCPATVVWGGSSGAYVATVTGRQAMSKMFVKGTYEIGGETYIRNGAPVAFEKVILGGVTYRVTVETVNNKKLMVLTEL